MFYINHYPLVTFRIFGFVVGISWNGTILYYVCSIQSMEILHRNERKPSFFFFFHVIQNSQSLGACWKWRLKGTGWIQVRRGRGRDGPIFWSRNLEGDVSVRGTGWRRHLFFHNRILEQQHFCKLITKSRSDVETWRDVYLRPLSKETNNKNRPARNPKRRRKKKQETGQESDSPEGGGMSFGLGNQPQDAMLSVLFCGSQGEDFPSGKWLDASCLKMPRWLTVASPRCQRLVMNTWTAGRSGTRNNSRFLSFSPSISIFIFSPFYFESFFYFSTVPSEQILWVPNAKKRKKK